MKIIINKSPIFFMLFLLVSIGCSDKDEIEKEITEPPIAKPEPPTEYDPGDANKIAKDEKISPENATASQHQPGTNIEKSIDGDKSTNYHSPWGNGTEYPVELEYFFTEDTEQIDYFILYPRSDGNNNGWIKKGVIYIQNRDDQEYQEFLEFEFDKPGNPKIIRFPEGFKDPKSLKISVTKGINDFVSLAEIEFYKKSASVEESLSIFEDKAATKLKPGTSLEDIEAIENEFIRNMAMAIYEDVYDEFRIGEFKSYPDPNIIAAENKTVPYGIYDNATGMYVKWGTEMVVFMNDFEGEIILRVVNHNQGFGGEDHVLQPGLNRFKVTTEGLAYLIYQDEQDYTVKANFATGKINGYFDSSKHTNADWQELIGNAEYSHFDILGEFAHLTFTTDDLRQNTNDIEELIGLYDELVDMEQEFMGLYKYDRANKTRMYFRTNTHQDMYMFATSYRTEYAKGTMGTLTNAQTFKSSPWGPAHEVGHVNQTRPGLKWLGMTEVTNNIHSLYVQTTWGNGARIDVEDLGEYSNRYEKGFTNLLNQKAHAEEGDVFVKLIPFWQLQLYMDNVRGQEDFYKDLYEKVRVEENQPNPGASQVEFVKLASDVAQLDLTEFFKSWGFLTPGSFDLDDYGSGTLTVTQQMADDAIAYVKSKGYSEPSEAVEYIHDQSVSLYKSSGSLSPGSVNVSGKEISITGASNATAFEQERGGEVIYSSPRTSFSVKSYDEDDTFYAVGVDGEREEIQKN
ncbi:F5/8 type C domain-containing protein [Salegentibacter echinorum]|uniref:F5/8 type C domain-containing protein n=1 Tax=Salegentibacter echinorum TaxID=1073325 RepID=A0A1M5KTW4_SALEC|nr:M60 family metallopeptidase [Salegentibacter echinorum]SHG56302.1 F5/8 type C domain-containing protein [Salegentibacter echinorum]